MADLIISDETWDQFKSSVANTSQLCGTLPRDYAKVPYGSMPYAKPLGSEIPIIPMEEWPDRIADQERTKSTLKHIWADCKIGVFNQSSLSYCHSFSSVMGLMITRGVMGLPKRRLSASSVAAPITNYQNKGWYIEDALKQMFEVGVATEDFVPMRTTKKSDFKAGWREDAARNRVAEFFDVPSRNILIHGSLLLSRHPVIVGLDYWGHAVADLLLRDMNRRLKATDAARYGSEFLNSWDASWGNEGFGVRMGSKFLADSIYAIRQGNIA